MLEVKWMYYNIKGIDDILNNFLIENFHKATNAKKAQLTSLSHH